MNMEQYPCGHPRTAENTMTHRRWRKRTQDYGTHKECRACHNRDTRKRYARKNAGRTRSSKYLRVYRDLGTDEVDL